MELRIPFQVMEMTASQIKDETLEALVMIKAALVRSVRAGHPPLAVEAEYDAQGNETLHDITWDFTQPRNLAYVNNLHCRNALMYLRESESRKWPDLARMMGPQVVYALKNGGVMRHSFNEITAILYPPAACKIMTFHGSAARAASDHVPGAQKSGTVVAFVPRAARAPSP